MQLAVQLQDIKLPKGTLTHVINVWECVSSLEHKKNTHQTNVYTFALTYLKLTLTVTFALALILLHA